MRWTLKKQRSLLIGLFIYLVLGYFVYHALHGERGIFSYINLSHELKTRVKVLHELEAQKEVLNTRVKLMHVDNLDLDMLDELARQDLGLANPDERVIIWEDNEGN